MKQEYYRYGLILMFLITLISVVLTILFWKKLQAPKPSFTPPELFPRVSIPVEDIPPTMPTVTPQPTVPATDNLTAPECKRAGCSSQLCLDVNAADVVTTCEFSEEYACYQQARCEVQPNGQCGFTQTNELQQCLEDND